MRMTFGSGAAIALAIVALAACGDADVINSAEASAESGGELVTAVGCPVQVEDSQCLTISAKGTVYDISAADPPVDMSRGVGVSLTGRAAGEVTECGAKLTDVQVDYLGLRCAPAEPAA